MSSRSLLNKAKAYLLSYIESEVDAFSKAFVIQNTHMKNNANNLLSKLLPISTFCFFFLNTNFQRQLIGVFMAWLFFKYFFKKVPDVIGRLNSSSIGLRCFAFISSVGICVGEWHWFYSETTIKWNKAMEFLGIYNPLDLPLVLGSVCAVLALLFVYCMLVFFWINMYRVISELKVSCDTRWCQVLLYVALSLTLIVCMASAFIKTEVFYGTVFSNDIIYTSDSPSLVKSNVYVSIANIENDLRQPLFAYFAAPFIGIAYLYSIFLGPSATIQAILVNSIQIFMFVLAGVFLAKTMKLNPLNEICFVFLSFCTYSNLLFCFMMEQYIVAYFWLMLCLYCICKNYSNRMVLWATGGTLITSLLVIPYMYFRERRYNIKEIIQKTSNHILEFVFMLIILSRVDVILKLKGKTSFYVDSFSGVGISFVDRLYQYFEFIHNCFLPPNTIIQKGIGNHIAWQLASIKDFNCFGIAIMLLALISAYINRKNKITLFAVMWVAFSFIMLACIGWGTKENGLVLYSIYFGWPFFLLIFQLLESIQKFFNTNLFIPIVTVVIGIILLQSNIAAINKIIEFGCLFYPAN